MGPNTICFFSCPLEFSTPHSSLLFHSRYLNMPLLQDERTLKLFLSAPLPICYRVLTMATV